LADRDPDVSVVIITVGRPSLYQLLAALESQTADFPYEIVVIANGPVDESLTDGDRTRVHNEPAGKGIPFYRNKGMELARGSVIAYIDDDEMPMDDRWLSNLVAPIMDGEEQVTVAGYHVPLGEGFFADLVSMLGYPGGGSLGWRNVYNVNESGHTDKLPSGNCAIKKQLLAEVGGFHPDLVLGASDLMLGEELLERGVAMRFVDEATVLHEARGDFRDFVRWQINRGRSVYNLQTVRPIRQFNRGHVGGRLKRTWLIIRTTFPTRRFFPMLSVLFLEYSLHAYGYVLEMVEKRWGLRVGRR
jgi:glycosyltransferase involved in cell wall biosynthesis